MQQPHLAPNPGPFQPVGLPLLGAAKGLPPPPQGLSGLPVALGGTAAIARPNGLHPQMMLPTPPPLVSVPHTQQLGPLLPGGQPPLVVPPHRFPPTTIPNTRPPSHTLTAGPPHHLAPASLDTSTHSTSLSSLPTPSAEYHTNSSLVRPRSPDRPRDSPVAKRARSRSPLRVTEDSDSDSEPPRSPEPEATILNKECHRSKNAIFVRHLSRGWNSCSRCDLQFRPTSESSVNRSREEKVKAITQSQPVKEPIREERRERREDEKSMKSESPQSVSSKPSEPTGFLPPSSAHLHAYGGRLSPGRPPYGMQDPTPALRQLSEYARPHVLGEPPRSLPYSVASLPGGPLMADPYYRMAAMYPPGSRERLELELDREKRERDAREREMREKELRDMELREKMKHEMEMKPPAGFERLLPPGANPMDPYWTELLKRYAAIPPTGVPGSNPGGHSGAPPGANPPTAHHPSQLPGIYPPAHLSNDLIRAERERLERLGEAARAASSDPLRNANLAYYEYFQRVSYEQIVLHRQALAQATGSKSPHSPEPADPRMADYARLAQHFARADPLSGGSAGGPHPGVAYPSFHTAHSLPPGHPLLEAARQQELLYRDLFSRSAYSTDPVLAQHLAAQQEAARIALERERLAAQGASSSRPPSHLH